MANVKPLVIVFTDGSYMKKYNTGGWAASIEKDGNTTIISGAMSDTTNNRAELIAIINALKTLMVPCKVLLYSDSQYCVNSIAKRWVYNWDKNNWMTKGWKGSSPKPVKNKDLFEELLALLKIHKVVAKWVRGHDGNEKNEQVDELAQSEALALAKSK